MDGRPPTRVDARFVGHATVLLELAGGRVLTDPLLRRSLGPLQRHGPPPDPAGLASDVVLVSHGHADHLDVGALAALPGAPVVVAPQRLGPVIEGVAPGRVLELCAGESATVGGLRIEAIEAHHWITPGAPRAVPLGYLVEDVSSGTTVYFAGDTGRFPGMAGLAGRVDVALLPVWTWGPHLGPGHLGPRSAAEVLAELRATAAVPIHWGTLYPRRLHHVLGAPLREPGIRFAWHAGRIAPSTDVRVLLPGEATSWLLPGRRR